MRGHVLVHVTRRATMNHVGGMGAGDVEMMYRDTRIAATAPQTLMYLCAGIKVPSIVAAKYLYKPAHVGMG